MNLDGSERRNRDRLAALEGEIWARRLLDELSTWDGPVQGDWPGSLEDARALATALSDGPKSQEALAHIIHQRARAVWVYLVQAEDIGAASPGNEPATVER